MRLLISTLIFMVCLSTYAAASVQDWRTEARYQALSLGHQLEDLKSRLMSTPAEDWTVADIQKYQQVTLRMVYNGKLAANYVRDQNLLGTSDLTSLVDLGYLPYWPTNPFNDWEPVRVLSVGDAFSAGDLVFQPCPPAYYSGGSSGQRWPQSFALFIYGPEPEFASVGEIRIRENSEWANWISVPDGAMYNLVFYVESADQVNRRYERRAREKEEQERKETEDKEESDKEESNVGH